MRKRAGWPLAGENGPLWIIAARQSAGRGRRGRAWQTRARQSRRHAAAAPRRAASRMAAAFLRRGLAVADMAAHFAPRAAIAVKWPNDVLADGSKLAGILLEGVPRRDWLAIGIGVNLASHPEGHRISRHVAGGAGQRRRHPRRGADRPRRPLRPMV